MEPYIVDATPKGSAILAYGTARGPRFNFRLIALVLICLVGITLLTTWFLSSRIMIPLPSNRLAQVAIKPSAIQSRLPSELRQSLPAPWRAAIETGSWLPAILGVTMGPSHELHAWALVPHTSVIVSGASLHVRDAGMFRLLTDGSDMQIVDEPLRFYFSESRNLRRHDAVWSVDGAFLEQLAGGADATSTGSNEVVRGTWDGFAGRITIKGQSAADEATPDASFFAVLGEEREAVAPAIQALMSQGIDLRALIVPPQRIVLSGVDGQPSQAQAQWDKQTELQDSTLIKSAADEVRAVNLALPDLTSVLEVTTNPSSTRLETPFVLQGNAPSSTSWVIQPGSIQLDAAKQGDQAQIACAGRLRLSIRGAVLQNILISWQVPTTWQALITSVELRESEAGTAVCLNR